MNSASVAVDLGILSVWGLNWRVEVGSDISAPNTSLTIRAGTVTVTVALEGEGAKWSVRARVALRLVVAPGATIILHVAESLQPVLIRQLTGSGLRAEPTG